jgi:hypothetical protein
MGNTNMKEFFNFDLTVYPIGRGYKKPRGQNMRITKMAPNRLIFVLRGFSTMGNTMAILFFNRKIKKLGS